MYKRLFSCYRAARAGSTLLGAAGLLASSMASAAITAFSDDFEGYTATDTLALENAGYLVFGFVETHSDPVNHTGSICTSNGGGDYGYGPFPAPNNPPSSPAFSTITTGEGGANQGAQVVSVYADYNNGDHSNGCILEHNFFREQVIDASNVGETWVFRFDYKAGGLVSPSTAQAFIKTIDGVGNLTNLVTWDTTAAPATWTEVIEISLLIDAGLVGQKIQFGFGGTSANFDASAIFYDNIAWFKAAGTDTDGDGIDDSADNCINDANTSQTDTDGDGHGNACDADFDQSCFVNFNDLNEMKLNFFSASAEHDLDDSNFVNFNDLNIVKLKFFLAPGPSACGACPCSP